MAGPAYEIRITHRAEKDIGKLTPKLRRKLYEVLTAVIAHEPFQGKKLVGDLAGSYSHRLTYKDRIVYSIDMRNRIVYIERAATHYGE
ncbi:MAG: type II toxin-antitoxin system RelE family toxin [Gammaproteobacteria bacterium]